MEPFDINIDDGIMPYENCLYSECNDSPASTAIIIPYNSPLLTYERCNAIQRKLAEFSSEEGIRYLIADNDEKKVNLYDRYFSEEELESGLWSLRKAKYQKKPLTNEERIEKVIKRLELSLESSAPIFGEGIKGILRILKSEES